MVSVGAILDLRDQEEFYHLFLEKILGLEAIVRMILSLHEIGVEKFYIILNAEQEIFENFNKILESYPRKYGIDVYITLWGEDDPFKNPLSQAIESLPDKMVIFKGCFIFSRKALAEIKYALSNNDNILFLLDNTVETAEQRFSVEHLGKGFVVLDKKHVDAYFRGEGEKLDATEISPPTIVYINSEESLKRAEKLLISDLSKPEDGFISYYINRKISTRISKLLVGTRVSSNAITLLSFLMMIIAAYLFSLGSFFNSIIAGILTQFSSIIDGCDGELARLRHRPSPYGGLLDTTLDRYGDILVTIGIFYGYANTLTFLNTTTVWLLSFIPITGFIMGSYVRKEYELKFRRKPKNSISLKLIRRDLRLFTIFLGSLINYPLEATLLIGSFTHLVIIWKFLIEPRSK